MSKLPAISIIIPVYNQAFRLHLTLESFCHQRKIENLPLEIILVDDGSTDGTADIAKQFITRLPLQYIAQTNQGRAVARNTGINASTGHLLLFTDADRPVGNYWVYHHMCFHQRISRAVAVGAIQEFFFSNLQQRFDALVQGMKTDFETVKRLSRPYSYWAFVKNTLDMKGRCLLNSAWIMTLIGNLSIERTLIEEVGQLDPSFTEWGFEHFELGYRLNKVGVSFWSVEPAVNYHLAHTRDPNFYENHITTSLKRFYEKHTDSSVKAFEDLLRGKLSIRDFDQINGEGISLLPENLSHLYYHAPRF